MAASNGGNGFSTEKFREELTKLVTALDTKSSVNAHRNREIETLFDEQLGLKVGVKSISESKQTKNRFSEIRNRADAPKHAAVVVGPDLVPGTAVHAAHYVQVAGGFTSVIVIRKTAIAEITTVVHRPSYSPLKELRQAYPDVKFLKA